MTQTYGFDSKREAQTKKNIGAKIWDAEIPDHSSAESLLVVIANGPVEYNASGPTYWRKSVTFRRATAQEFAPVRIAEIENKLMPSLRPHWDRDKWVDGVRVTCADLDADEIRDRATYLTLKAELSSLKAVANA